ncbi:hypothetical protein [Methanonatronarchaeum sp. AMET6-2]|uniref:hypothetical protein n=1 Tax=Methanonatronarchaeum sp. AMET6-2 TaxID=2933293 RepID=UPI001FF648A8|nr:hypothetical protein [Methanonatronarchaeum sp. AMET6-2]UOY09655.1 hypothetical protein MU439_05205 [Methanonatronarchaeum sp. AMET6-2]
MPSFDVNPKKMIVFKLADKYVFKQYFDQKQVFTDLSSYYNNSKYRFEFTEPEKQSVLETLREHNYQPELVKELKPYIVGKKRYTKHASILKNSVSQRMIGDYNLFLMKDTFSVERALEEDAEQLDKLEIERTAEEVSDPDKWK